MQDRQRQACVSALFALKAMCGLFAVLLMQGYLLLVIPAVVAFIGWDMMASRASRRLLVTGLLVGAVCGMISGAYGWTPTGWDARVGIGAGLPLIAFATFASFRIYFLESKAR